jgi:Uma2 family endonuclease
VANQNGMSYAGGANMDTLVLDPYVSERLLRERRDRGIDVFDEVWDGVYVMAPAPNDEHQEIEMNLAQPLLEVVRNRNLGTVRLRVNVASDPTDWEHDYRIPDIVVFLNGSRAVCHDTFWSGPPDFIIEIASPNDKTREKLGFYAKVETRELLLIDRDPWRLELYRLKGKSLGLVASLAPGDATAVSSEVLPMTFKLLPGNPRPTIEVAATDLERTWTI